MAPGKDQIVLQASEAFKAALGAYAAENKIAMAAIIREAVAEKIGYDLAAEPATQRSTRYASKEDRKKAALARATVKRQLQKQINEALKKGDLTTAAKLASELQGN